MNKTTIIRTALGISIGSTLLYFSMQGVNYKLFASSFDNIKWRYVLMGISLYLGNFILRSMRWKILLSKLDQQNLGTIAKFIFVGYAVNNILPARLGEIFRAYYTAKALNLNF